MTVFTTGLFATPQRVTCKLLSVLKYKQGEFCCLNKNETNKLSGAQEKATKEEKIGRGSEKLRKLIFLDLQL